METRRKNPISEMMDKVSFVNYLPLLTRATAENHEPIPGYLFQEIENISRQPDPNCQMLVDYLAQRLDRPSSAVKLKVLKIMNHLIHNGPRNFRHLLRKRDGSIKMATSYHEAVNPLTGTSSAEAVRKQSQDLLQLLFDAQLIASDESSQPEQLPVSNLPVLGGLGRTSSASGKYEGFGNSPIIKEDSFTDKMLNAIERWTTSTDQTDLIIKEALTSSPGKYEPVTVDLQIPTSVPKQLMHSKKPHSKNRAHVPGKAGGGWDDDPPASFSGSFLEEGSVASTDSSELGATTTEITVSEAEGPNDTNTTPEAMLVQNFCSSGQLPCSLADIRSTGQRCIQLNVKEVVQTIVQVLEAYPPQKNTERSVEAGSAEVQLTKAMLLLEWLLRTDIVHHPTVAEMCHPCLSQIAALDAPFTHSKPPPLQAKAEKLLLILQKLKALPT